MNQRSNLIMRFSIIFIIILFEESLIQLNDIIEESAPDSLKIDITMELKKNLF